jgi:PAS domain S-box-containing protein
LFLDLLRRTATWRHPGSPECDRLTRQLREQVKELESAALRLRTERDLRQDIFDNMAEGFGIIDSDWRVVQMNAAGLACTHRTSDQVIGRNHWEVWPEMRGTAMQGLYERVMETGEAESLKQPMVFASGEAATFEISAQRKPNGSLAVFFRDTTKAEQIALALRSSQAHAEAALSIAQLGSFTWRQADDQVTFSDRTREIFGFAHHQGGNRSDYFRRVRRADRDRVRDAFEAARIAGGRVQVQCKIWMADGSERDVLCNGTGERNEAGEWTQFTGVFDDISSQETASNALRHIDRRKDEFLGMLAHELRNPLAPIVMAAELLKRPNLSPASIQNVSTLIQRQTRHMTGLLADLMDVSRINKGLVTLTRARLDLQGVLASAVEQTWPMMEKRSQQFIRGGVLLPVYVEGDENRFVQIFANVLNNASKYTPDHGRIALTVERGPGDVVVRITDTGVGISAELLPHVFEIFTQAERSSDRHLGGLGLGLSLVKNLVELQGGNVTARSAGADKGSEITVTLPVLSSIPDAESLAPLAVQASNPAPLRVLVVDDNMDAASTLAMLLETEGHIAAVANTAEDALHSAQAAAREVFILDIGLPRMDGYELARRIRARPGAESALLIALTGYGQPEDREKSRLAGFDVHLEKPIDPPLLLDVLRRYGQAAVSMAGGAVGNITTDQL